MSLRPILRWPDPRLALRCRPVAPDEDVAALAADLLDTMYAAPGRGLAAPQVGDLRRVFVMDATWRQGTPDPVVCINPEILWASDERAEGPEGCLSIPGAVVTLSRATVVRLGFTDLEGRRRDLGLRGFAAVCAQHELDHLDGVVTLDRLSPAARDRAVAGLAG